MHFFFYCAGKIENFSETTRYVTYVSAKCEAIGYMWRSHIFDVSKKDIILEKKITKMDFKQI